MPYVTPHMTFAQIEALPHMERAAGYLIEMRPESAAKISGVTLEMNRALYGEFAGRRMRLGIERLVEVANEYGSPDIELWDETAIVEVPGRERTRLFRFPAPKPGAPFVLVIPGGGYCSVCSAFEGFTFAKELNDAGYAAFVLSYRTREAALMPAPIEDAVQALRQILAHADELQVAPRYAVAGFSAGAHLAGELCSDNWGWKRWDLPRPAAALLGYPAVDMRLLAKQPPENETVVHMLDAMFGASRDDALLSEFDVVRHVAAEFPPTFTWQAEDDATIPFASSAHLVMRLGELGVPFEYHAYAHGDHGLVKPHDSDADQWPTQAIAFLVHTLGR